MAGYGSDIAFAAWMADHGYVLPSGAPTPAVLRQRGANYIDATYEARFVGTRAGGYAQERSWPRVNAALRTGETVPGDVVPLAVEHASYIAAWAEASAPGSLAASGSASGAVKREKVDVIEVEYQAATDMDLIDAITVRFTEIEGLLAPFLRAETTSGAGFLFCSVGC